MVSGPGKVVFLDPGKWAEPSTELKSLRRLGTPTIGIREVATFYYQLRPAPGLATLCGCGWASLPLAKAAWVSSWRWSPKFVPADSPRGVVGAEVSVAYALKLEVIQVCVSSTTTKLSPCAPALAPMHMRVPFSPPNLFVPAKGRWRHGNRAQRLHVEL